MAWERGLQFENQIPVDPIDELDAIRDKTLSNEEARYFLGKIFFHHPGFAWEFLSRGRLFKFQEIIIRGWFAKDNNLFVATRGIGKSYLIAIFCLLYAIYYPGSKVVIVSSNFRQSKNIFAVMEKFLRRPEAVFLRQCFMKEGEGVIAFSKRPDEFILSAVNGSTIKGLPLSGEQIRGQRANVLMIDEGLLVSEHIQKTILQPFLMAKYDIEEQEKTKEIEDRLIKEGHMTEEGRTLFPNNKLIINSSASFKFEYLCKGIYEPYLDVIMNPTRKRSKKDASYFVARMGYEAVPKGVIVDEAVVEAIAEGNKESASFKREIGAIFCDGSDGYFNYQKLQHCTHGVGKYPMVQLKGNANSRYILSIDPAYGENKTNDYFAMCVFLIDEENKTITQVHTYGRAGAPIDEHYEYFSYLLRYFNIVYVIIDASGTEFTDSFNSSTVAKRDGLNVSYLESDFETESEEYVKALNLAKNQLNKETRKFVYRQKFNSNTIRRMHEYMQGQVVGERIWFASPLVGNDRAHKEAMKFELPYAFKDADDMTYDIGSFAEDQDDWLNETKKQIALIAIKPMPNGNHQYDIPTHMKNSSNAKRPRRDHHTCVLMACYAAKHYFEIMTAEEPVIHSGFVPFMMR